MTIGEFVLIQSGHKGLIRGKVFKLIVEKSIPISTLNNYLSRPMYETGNVV